MTDREKLIALLQEVQYLGGLEEKIADHLIANGVTFATDNNVGDKMSATDKDTNVLTNADRIRAMTDKELREFMCFITDCRVCPHEKWSGCGLLEWLKQPAEEGKK